MVDDIILQKRTLRVLIISALLVTVCLIFLNPDLAIPSDSSQIDYFGVLAVSLVLLLIFHFWGKIFFTLYVLEGLVVRWYGPEYIEPADSIFLLFTYLEGMIEGAILVLIFLTPMKNLFKSVKGYL